MRRRLSISLIFIVLALFVHAETIVLRMGSRVHGSIVFQNEEVVIIRDAEGARFQYPRADILEILEDEEFVDEQKQPEEETILSSKKVSILLELGGGAAMIPNDSLGGAFSVDLLVGSHHLAGRHLFVGAGVGYHGLFIGAEKYNFLPIQVAVRMPLAEDKHTPVFGAAVGYGVALSKLYLGGVYAGLDFGYRCQLNTKTAIALVLTSQFQQAQVSVTEVIEGHEYTNHTGRSLVTVGLKLSLYF